MVLVKQIFLEEFPSIGSLLCSSYECVGTQIHEVYQDIGLSLIFTLNWSSLRFRILPFLLGFK